MRNGFSTHSWEGGWGSINPGVGLSFKWKSKLNKSVISSLFMKIRHQIPNQCNKMVKKNIVSLQSNNLLDILVKNGLADFSTRLQDVYLHTQSLTVWGWKYKKSYFIILRSIHFTYIQRTSPETKEINWIFKYLIIMVAKDYWFYW